MAEPSLPELEARRDWLYAQLSASAEEAWFDVLPAVNGGDSSSAAHAVLRWVPASAPAAAGCGLTPAPQAFGLSARPAANMFFAALMSRSWTGGARS